MRNFRPATAALALVAASFLHPRELFASACVWDGSTGDWTDTVRWTGCAGGFPDSGDTAAISGGSVNLPSNQAAGGLTLSGGTITGAGNLALTGTSSWTAGSMSGSGTTTIAAGGTLTISGTVGVGRTITNNGTISWTAGQIQMVDGTIDNNAAFTAQPDNSMANFGGTNAFNNNASGTFTRNTGTGFLDINIPFTNVGTTTVSTGTLRIAGGGTSTGTINAASAAVNFTNNYDVTAGTFNVGTLTLSGGTINMTPGTYTVATANLISSTYNLNKASAASNWTQSGGSLSGSGAVTIASGKTYTWTAGGMAGTGTTTIAAGGTLTISGTVGVGRTITNNGTISWTAGQIQMVDGTIDNNAAFTAQPDNSMANFGGTNAFNNNASGTFTRNTGTGFLDINIPFTNVGTTTVSTGTLRIAGGGTSTGTINAASAAVNFTNNYDVTAGTFNVGTLTLSGGTINMTPGTYTVATANLISSTYNLNKASAASNWTQSGGSLSGSGAVTIASGKTYTWTAGGMAGTGTTTIAAGGTLTISGTVGVGRTITNNGTISWTAGQIQMVDGTIDNNAAFTAQPDNSMANFGGTNAFNNNASGTFTRNTGTGFLDINIPFTNVGTTTVSTGTLRIAGGGTSTGTINAASAAVNFTNNYDVTAGTFNVGTLTLSGGTINMTPGTYTVATANLISSTYNLNKASAASNWTQSGGSLSGSGAVTIASGKTYAWTAGGMAGTGTTTIAAGGTLTIGGTVGVGRTITNNGTISWTAGQIQMVDGTIDNNTTLSLTNDDSMANFGGTNALNNNAAGILTRSTSTGTVSIGVPVNNAGTINASSGTLALTGGLNQTAGQTILNGGALGGGGSTLDFQGGVLKGVGTITANASNSATVSPGASPGVISIVGNYTQTAAGTLAIEMNGTSAGTQYDQLAVTGTVTLAGALSLTLGFTPVTSTPFTLITNADTEAVAGNFASLAEGAVLVTPNVNFRVTYQGGTGNDMVLTPLFQALYHTVPPCRVGDTRTNLTPALAAGQVRSFPIAGQCTIPSTAQAVSFNFTVVGPTGGGDLRIFPGDAALPTVSTLNYRAGQVRANNAILLLGPDGDISVRVDQANGSVHFIIDVNGYFE